MLKPRAAVQNLDPYSPPLAGRSGLRLDFNENTAGCSPRVLQQLCRFTAEELARYPDRGSVEPIVARFLGLQPEQVLLTNGVDEAIHLLCETYLEPEDEVLFVAPTFAMYELYARAAGARAIAVPAAADFALPTQDLLRRISPRTRLIAIANPNNPTGTVARQADLLRIAQSAQQAAVLVDEAYFEFFGESVVGELVRGTNLFVARTFSKAYGLAGLRLGVLAGSSEQIPLVKRVSSPYNVNAVALACLPEVLSDQTTVNAYVAEVRASRARLEDKLSRLHVRFWSSQANFVLVRIGERHKDFVAAMGRRGVLIRDRSSDPGCEGCVRITVGRMEHTEFLLRALRETLVELHIMREVTA